MPGAAIANFVRLAERLNQGRAELGLQMQTTRPVPFPVKGSVEAQISIGLHSYHAVTKRKFFPPFHMVRPSTPLESIAPVDRDSERFVAAPMHRNCYPPSDGDMQKPQTPGPVVASSRRREARDEMSQDRDGCGM